MSLSVFNLSKMLNVTLKNSLIFLIILGLVLIVTTLIHAKDKPSITSSQVVIDPILYYIENGEKLTPERLVHNAGIVFKVTTNPTEFSHNANTIWLKITAHNASSSKQVRVLNTTNNQILSAKIFEVSLNNIQANYKLLYQHNQPFIQDLPYFTSEVASRVSFEAGESKTFLIQYHSLMSTHMHISFDSLTESEMHHNFEEILLWSVISVLFVLIFINFVFYFSLNKIQYLFYCLQSLVVVCILLVTSGYSTRFIHPDSAGLSQLIIVTLICFFVAFSMLFSKEFLNLSSLGPRIKHIPTVYVWLSSVVVVLNLVPVTQVFMLQFVTPVFVFSFIVMAFFLGCIAVYKGAWYAIPYCIAWIILIASIGISMMSFIDIYHIDMTRHIYPAYVGYILEGALLSLSMAWQVAVIRKDSEISMKKLIDIYKERSVEAFELQQAFMDKELALKDNVTKNSHLAGATHDISHSLFLIKLGIESLKTEFNQRQVQATQASLTYLEGITHQILESSKSEHITQFKGVKVDSLFKDICDEQSHLAKGKNIKLRYKSKGIYLKNSSVILKRIIENLVRNALQHTYKGGVLLSIRDLSDCYKIQVFDTGNGIDQIKQDKLQRAFSQDYVTTSGYGMGLYIVTNLCQQTGFTLTIDSKVGKGSIFSVIIDKSRELDEVS